MGDNNLVYKFARRVPFPATQQTVADDETFELRSKFEEALFKAWNGRFGGHSTSSNPSSYLVDY